MHFIKAKYKGKCMETGQTIRKGEECLFIPGNGVYAKGSKRYAKEQDREIDQAGDMLDEGIEQRHENWYANNY